MKLKNILFQTCLVLGGTAVFSSCEDFLDREPLSSVTPEAYFTTTDHLAAYSISQYQNWFDSHAGYSMGIGNGDAATDNAVTGGYNASLYEKDAWKVPNSGGGWSFTSIRYCNYFFEQVLPKYEGGKISGSKADIDHYIGEMYFMRAWIYFHYLKNFGDYPIITEVLPDNKEVLMEKAVRQPRNKVARFILEDLDKAIGLLHSWGFSGNNRINKETALLVKSRVALYEATFEKYHKGTGRVPGDENWPGKRVHPDFNLDVNKEVDFFLDEAIKAAEQVADKVTLTANTGVQDPATITTTSGWNPYFEMFATEDLSSNSEVLMWREYKKSGSFTISHGAPAWVQSGCNNGLLKTYMESFLMADGMPWYAATDAAPYAGDKTLDDVKANRDNRLQLFVFGESNFLPIHSQQKDETQYFLPHPVSNRQEMQDRTGYRLRKYASFDKAQNVWGKAESTTGCIIFRGVEAYLNYLEAYYLKNNKVDGKAAQYWKAVRDRAKVDSDFNKTIAATDMNQETDWGKYSGTETVDATLLNIRRERRCEFIGENMRWDDLVRWRSMDHMLTKRFIPEGCNFWDEMYKTANLDENGAKIEFNYSGVGGANISSPEESKYIRPYCVMKANNPVYDGYTWAKANYLSPVPVREMELLSPDETVEKSVLYQNPYWPTTINGVALE